MGLPTYDQSPIALLHTRGIVKKWIAIFLLLAAPAVLSAQQSDQKSRITFSGDFRFRIEHDWDSRRPDGTYRDDRTRLRYRVRAGIEYQHNERASAGIRLRTGDPTKQQDPQLTLGEGFREFSMLPIGLEKAYFMWDSKSIRFWLGKNTFPYEKQQELFWSDNVFPEGVYLEKKFSTTNSILTKLAIGGGHFVINARGKSFSMDSYFQGFQVKTEFSNRIKLFPSLYLFRNIQNIPDGFETFLMDYSIFHVGTSGKLNVSPLIQVELDYYYNFENYDNNDSIPAELKNQKTGWVVALGYGQLKAKNDWHFKITYTHLERYAAVDFLAQNDWARWDYAEFGSLDGRLTNMKGWELVAAYMVDDNLWLTMKYYTVRQIVPYGPAYENGQRIRLDLDLRF